MSDQDFIGGTKRIYQHLLTLGVNLYLGSILSTNNFPAGTSFLFGLNFTGCWAVLGEILLQQTFPPPDVRV